MSKQTDNLPANTVPEIDGMERLLSQFIPHPTNRFQRKISTAPWMKHNSTWVQRINIPLFQAKTLSIAAVLLLIAFMIMLFVPSVRAVARQIFFSFINAPANHVEVQVNLDDPAELFHYSDPSNFTQSIDQVEKQAGFEIKELSSLPEGLELVGARYDHNYAAVTILYQAHDYKLFLTQRQVNHGKDVFSIGSAAQVAIVTIGNHQGEFVVGGWKAISTQAASPSAQSDTQVNVRAVWDHDLAQFTLRWQADGYTYELRSVGDGSPSQSELISLADGLK